MYINLFNFIIEFFIGIIGYIVIITIMNDLYFLKLNTYRAKKYY